MAEITLALDIGGSSVKWGWMPDGAPVEGATIEAAIHLADQSFVSVESAVNEAVERAGAHGTVSRIGISTSGSVDRDGVVISAGHFEGYKNIDWRERLVGRHPSVEDVVTVNDGRAAAWGEYMVDSADPKAATHIHAVVGTGVGGGIVQDGELLLGDSGQAGYLGHMKITRESTVTCSCGREGHVEALAAVPALRHAWDPSGASADGLENLRAAAQAGDPRAHAVLRQAGWWLGIGLSNAMNVVNPTVVTIGGGVVLLSAELDGDPYFVGALEGIEEGAHRRVFAAARVEHGRLGNDAGVIGAGLLLSA